MKLPFLALAALLATPAYGDLVDPLPESASKKELRFQPLMDFDGDACYATAAIGRDGKMNPGLANDFSVTHDCRRGRLQFSNAYSRKRCNHGYCAIMYEYYFEKDQSAPVSGHRHDFENVVVFTKGDRIVRMVAKEKNNKEYKWRINCLGSKRKCKIPMLNGHPLVVYHKVHNDLHEIRFAKEKRFVEKKSTSHDIEEPENETEKWFRSPLIGYDHWPDEDVMARYLQFHDKWEKPHIRDEAFGHALKKAAGSFKSVPGFDPFQVRNEDDDDEDVVVVKPKHD
ncbi:necrosis inducing protein-domain-containing protein [Fusarium flagelliforme]|uniref:necrosis inducing protein-domain-containing protein n=1 Tax=Fusarium flagelliforme TaxID=2675880 RepID=UPI001E8E2657|nr:necrosis inducing protein-domain-containing protein [Fusarium flagelliforme]KAH7192881.1 necrosis inducing protein-domain-containing protein [Fusarium flagelliforme]